MSMLDSFFSKGFRAAKCKTLLKLTIPRIKLLRNRREIQIKQMRRDIAKLLETGQEATARIRVEHIIREENMMAAQEILELFSELIAVRLPIIEAQRECPLDLKEAISSLCFAAPRCADLPELLQVQLSFVSKYGKEFVAAATELMPDCGVNRQLIELLSIRAPSAEKKLKLLKQIAEEHDLDWDPAASETELFKSHEDLLNGPTQFSSGTKVPLPDEKHEELSQASFNQTHHEQHDSDEDLDLDFPEVPTVVVHRPGENTASAPTILPYSPPVLHPETDPEPLDHSAKVTEERFIPEKDEKPQVEDKQFLPFIAPPLETLCSSPPQQITRAKSDVNVDLQDVLAAAQAAAETAERAAMAARSAASLAQLRISELIKKNSDQTLGKSTENPFHITTEKARLDRNDSITDSDGIVSPPEPHRVHESLLPSPSPSPTKPDFDPTLPQPDPTHHRPQRLPSMEDEPYFSYPNLFRSQSSKLGSPSQSFKDDSLSPNGR